MSFIISIALSSCSESISEASSNTDKVYSDTLISGNAYTFTYPHKYSINWVENCIYIGRVNEDTSFSKTQPEWTVCIAYKGNIESEIEFLKRIMQLNYKERKVSTHLYFAKWTSWIWVIT